MLKKLLKKTFVYTLYKKHKKQKIESRLKGKHIFENRKKGSKILVLILAGYKDFCKDVVFERIKTFVPKEADVCIVSSGLYSEALSNLAKQNDWSYISCKRNNVCAAINIGINEFQDAELIFKLDEDIFVTKNYFSELLDVYSRCQEKNSLYEPAFVAPLIPINGFAHAVVLKKLGLMEKYAELFEPVRIQAGPHRQIENNPEVAKFMWGEGGYVMHIDDLDRYVHDMKKSMITCPIKFSIGAILFGRNIWKDMNYFDPGKGNGMGADEVQICGYAMINSKPIVVSENTCVGHLSFGKQNKTMESYFLEHKDRFEIKK